MDDIDEVRRADDPNAVDDRPEAVGETEHAVVGPEGYGEGTRIPSLKNLTGMTVRDRSGDKAGRVSDVYLDDSGRYVRYLGIHGGLMTGRRRHLVPVDDVEQATDDDGDPYLALPYMKDQLTAGPDIGPGDDVTPDMEATVYSYYERIGYWDRAREILAARQATPAPTPQIAEAELADAISRGRPPEDVVSTRVRRWRA